ncbi:MAG: acyl-CoA dehydrogenase, partial [Acidimicrobiales bacterium]|nr:acyl-CoA dehydrogenase [Acidimicrobiales bacterium]
MDLNLSDDQLAIQSAVNGIFERHRRPATRFPSPVNEPLLAALEEGGYLDLVEYSSPMEAVLVVEFGAQAVAEVPLAARALVAPLVGLKDLPLNIALAENINGSIVRWGVDFEMLLAFDGEEAVTASRDDCDIEPVASRYGYPFARVHARKVERLGEGSGLALRRAWQLAIGAEIAGSSLGAIDLTSKYVAQRFQFGRPIGSFQAVQHRLATAYIMAEAARWLTRRASATPDDEYLSASAATVAFAAGRNAYTATHQVSGGIGITSEHGLVGYTMRLLALQQEFGGQ